MEQVPNAQHSQPAQGIVGAASSSPVYFKPVFTTSHSETLGKIATALAKAQAKIEGAKKDAENDFYKSSYADLSSVWDACHGPLSENEIAVVQLPQSGTDAVTIVTMLIHSSGEWIKSTLTMVPKDKGPQAVGSALTYARRYALSAMVGVCPVDDDGEAAMGRGNATGKPPKKDPIEEMRQTVRSLNPADRATFHKRVLDSNKTTKKYTEEELTYIFS